MNDRYLVSRYERNGHAKLKIAETQSLLFFSSNGLFKVESRDEAICPGSFCDLGQGRDRRAISATGSCKLSNTIVQFASMWVKRYYEGILRRLTRQRPGILLTGARQTGKTSLLKHTFPEHRFVSLDLPSEAEEAERNPSSFLARHGTPLIVDEVQYAPGLFRHLKVAIDSRRRTRGQYLLTGSQKFTLMKGISESLAGRVEVLELETLSLNEIRAAYPEIALKALILRGGYPELYQDLSLDHHSFYRSYVATYLERDLRSVLNVTDLRDFERFLRACALRSGQLLNKADLARDVGISPSTANQWISALAASNLLILLEPWFVNASKSITKSPKLYFADTGLLLYLLNVRSVEELDRSPLLGSLWETYVFAELRKKDERESGAASLYFWRDRGREIDFLRHRGGNYDLIEVKWSEHPSPEDTRAFADFAAIAGAKRILSRTLICRAPNRFPLPGGIEAVPVEEAVR